MAATSSPCRRDTQESCLPARSEPQRAESLGVEARQGPHPWEQVPQPQCHHSASTGAEATQGPLSPSTLPFTICCISPVPHGSHLPDPPLEYRFHECMDFICLGPY